MGKVRVSIRLYKIHDLDLISFIKTHKFDFKEAAYCALKAFSKNEHFIINIPPLRNDNENYSLNRLYLTTLVLDEDIDADAIEVLSKIKEGGRNNFLKNLLRLYLCNPISESFLNDINDAPYFYEKFEIFKSDKKAVNAGNEAKTQWIDSKINNLSRPSQTNASQNEGKINNNHEDNKAADIYENKDIEQPLSENIPSESIKNSDDITDMFSSIIG